MTLFLANHPSVVFVTLILISIIAIARTPPRFFLLTAALAFIGTVGVNSIIAHLFFKPYNEKVAKLEFMLDESKVPLNDQKSLTRSPIDMVRVALARHKNTDEAVLKLLLLDPTSDVKVDASVNMQKRNIIPIITLDEYKELHSKTTFYVFLGVSIIVGLLFFWSLRTKKFDYILLSGSSLLLALLVTRGIHHRPETDYQIYRGNVVKEKIKNHTLSNREFVSVLDTLSSMDPIILAENVSNLTDKQVLQLYSTYANPVVEKEMKKRNLVKADVFTLTDFE